MTGQPIRRDMVNRLCEIANPEHLDLPTDFTPEQLATEYLVAYIESGGRVSQLTAQLGVARWTLNRWIYADEERKSRVMHARTLSSHALVDEGGDLLDSATRDTIAVANARAGWRKWLASKYDPQGYGDAQSPQVSIGSLHLHAALHRPPLAPVSPPLALTVTTPAPVNSPKPPLLGAPQTTGEREYPTESKVEVGTLPVSSPPLASTGGE